MVKPGRTFLRRLIDLSITFPSLNSPVILDKEARLDLEWWQTFILAWNGRELIPPPPVTSAQLGLSTDASKLGMGGIFGSHWFSCAWPVHMVHKHINVLEMVAIAAAILLSTHLYLYSTLKVF